MERQVFENIASALGVRPKTVRMWWWRKKVPHWARLPILQEAAKRGLTVDHKIFDALEMKNEDEK